jgi:hypothetical protein
MTGSFASGFSCDLLPGGLQVPCGLGQKLWPAKSCMAIKPSIPMTCRLYPDSGDHAIKLRLQRSDILRYRRAKLAAAAQAALTARFRRFDRGHKKPARLAPRRCDADLLQPGRL